MLVGDRSPSLDRCCLGRCWGCRALDDLSQLGQLGQLAGGCVWLPRPGRCLCAPCGDRGLLLGRWAFGAWRSSPDWAGWTLGADAWACLSRCRLRLRRGMPLGLRCSLRARKGKCCSVHALPLRCAFWLLHGLRPRAWGHLCGHRARAAHPGLTPWRASQGQRFWRKRHLAPEVQGRAVRRRRWGRDWPRSDWHGGLRSVRVMPQPTELGAYALWMIGSRPEPRPRPGPVARRLLMVWRRRRRRWLPVVDLAVTRRRGLAHAVL